MESKNKIDEFLEKFTHKDVYKVSLRNTNDYVFCSNTDDIIKYLTNFKNMKFVPKKQFLEFFDTYYNNPKIYVYRDINDYREICTNKIIPVLDYKKIESARRSNDINKKIEAWISAPSGISLEDAPNIFVSKSANMDIKRYAYAHYLSDDKLKQWQDFLDYKILLANSNALSYLNQQRYENEFILKRQ